jgi:hypothetical protein
VALLIVLSIAVAIFDGGGGTATKRKTSVASSRLGTQAHPIPLRHTGGVWGGWRLRVTSVAFQAAQLLGSEPRRLPPGGREVMVSVAAKFNGGGHAYVSDLFDRTFVTGLHRIAYEPDSGDLNCALSHSSRLARPLNESVALVFSDHGKRGHLCFAVAENDVKTLALYVDAPGCNTSRTVESCAKQVWFALR